MTMFSQDQVNQWFAANPNATQQDVANTVQGLGGLDANPGLAGMIGQHYGTDAATVSSAYNQLTAAPSTPAPSSISDLYSTVLGRAPDEGGLAYWQQQFGDTLDPNEIATFKTAAAPELAMSNYKAPAAPTQPYEDVVSTWAKANPTATPSQITKAIQDAGGLTPALADAVAKQYGTTAADVNAQYQTNQGINSLYQTYLGRAPESQAVVDMWAKQFGPTIDPNEIAAFRAAAAPELAQTHYLSTPMRGDIQQYVSGVLADNTLSDWEKTNKIMQQAQKSNITQAQLEDVYGKQNVQPYLDTYKAGITDYINKALATDPTKTTFDEVGQIHQAAAKYGLSAEDIAKYTGMDPKQAKSYFDTYEQGLGTIVSRLNDPKVDDITKTQTALALQQKYGATDEELAKASKGKYTAEDIKAYLDPVRNVPTNLQKLFDDPNATAADIQKFVNEAKADPRAAGIYGAALDKVTVNQPALLFRDVLNGNDSYQSAKAFLTAAKATPELATQYAPQIQGIEQILAVTDRARNKDFGGKLPDYAMSMFLGLDKKTQSSAPKQLELTPPKTETRTDYDEFGVPYTYQTNIPAELKTGQKGVQTLTDEAGNVTGYTKKVDSADFKNLQANYDANGNLLGYEDRSSRVHVSDPQYYYAKFDANGVAKPGTGANRSGGFLKNTLQDVASMGPVGQIALMAATGGLGGALASQFGGGMLANALASGVVSGTLSEVGGGDFGKGFAGGAIGSGVGNLAGSYMPTDMTGNPMVDSYLAKALPTAAGSMARTGVMGGSLADAGLYSLLNTGVNMGTGELIKDTPLSTLDPSVRPYATGVASNLISSTLAGKNPNVQNALMNTMLQQTMKPAAKP